MTKTYISYFRGGIGGFLLNLHLFNVLKENGCQGKYIVVCGRDGGLYRTLAREYPHVKVHEIHWANIFKMALLSLRVSTSKVYSVTAPSFSKAPLSIRIWLFLLTQITGGVSIGFTVRGVDPSFTKHVIPLNHYQSLFVGAASIARVWGCVVADVPTPTYNVGKESSPEKNGIFVHPFGMSLKRSMSKTMFRDVVQMVGKLFPEEAIYVSGSESQMQEIDTWNVSGVQPMKGSLMEKLERIQDAKLFIGVDTGITHAAALMGAPTLMVGNLSNPCWLATYVPNAKTIVAPQNCVCNGNKWGNCYVEVDGIERYRCMADISLDDLNRTLRSLISPKNEK